MIVPSNPEAVERRLIRMNVSLATLGSFLVATVAAVVATPSDSEMHPVPGESLVQDRGPYIRRNADGQIVAAWIENHLSSATVIRRALDVGDEFPAGPIGSLPKLTVRLRQPIYSATEISAPEASALVVSNVHGHYEALVDLLKIHRVIDTELRWSYGGNWLIVLGDVIDHGPAPLSVLWLLYHLEAEARAAGGGFSLVLGEAELLLLRGADQGLHAATAVTARRLGATSFAGLFSAESILGEWLRTRPVVFRWSDSIITHRALAGALTERRMTVAQINRHARDSLQLTPVITGPRRHLSIVGWLDQAAHPDVPVRSQGVLTGPSEEIEAALRFHRAKRIVIAENVPVPARTSHGGRLIAIETMPRYDRQRRRPQVEGVIIEHAGVRLARSDGTTEPLSQRLKAK